jgi:hypothetical protein
MYIGTEHITDIAGLHRKYIHFNNIFYANSRYGDWTNYFDTQMVT